MAVLEVRELTVLRGECPVVDRLSFAVSGGEVLALVGPNGAGKSTALKGLLGLVPATGSVRLDGADVLALEPRQRARQIAWVPQRSRLNAAMSCTNVVAMGRFAHSGGLARLAAGDAQAVAEALALADAAHLSLIHI
jgi:iron complex transport system ATP-binding protein